MTTSKKNIMYILLVGLVIISLMFGCQASNSGSDDTADPCVAGSTCDDVQGFWNYTGWVMGSCDPDHSEGPTTFTITPNESCSFNLTSLGRSGTGTVDGSSVCLNATSYADGGGTTSIAKTTLTHSSGEITGTSSWTWSDGTDSCTGTTLVDLDKI